MMTAALFDPVPLISPQQAGWDRRKFLAMAKDPEKQMSAWEKRQEGRQTRSPVTAIRAATSTTTSKSC